MEQTNGKIRNVTLHIIVIKVLVCVEHVIVFVVNICTLLFIIMFKYLYLSCELLFLIVVYVCEKSLHGS